MLGSPEQIDLYNPEYTLSTVFLVCGGHKLVRE